MTKYRPAPGSRLNNAAAQALGEVMARLRSEDRLTPSDLLNEARAPTSAIHHLYEWNDDKAAQMWRLEQAAHHLRSVEVVIHNKDGSETATRFAYVREGSGLGYVTINDIGRDRTLASEIADQLYKGAWEWLATYRTYCRQFRVRLRPLRPIARSIAKVKKPAA